MKHLPDQTARAAGGDASGRVATICPVGPALFTL